MNRSLAFILSCCLLMPAFANGEDADRPQRLLSQMTTEQKAAQLLMPAFSYYRDEEGSRHGVSEMTPEISEMLQKYGFGGVIFSLQNAPDNQRAALLASSMQRANALAEGRPRLIICTDQEGGYVTRLAKGTQMPGSMALGAVNDLSVTESAAGLIGSEVTALGYTGVFAPVVDINNNPANPIIGIRSFSDDPQTVAEQGAAFIRGLHAAGSLAVIKHFPGHGDTDTDSHTGLPCVNKSYEALKAFELIPFQACVSAGADMVMTAHIVYPQVETGTYTSVETGEKIGLPATLSKTFLTDILRGEMGFEGLIVTDAMTMDAVAKHFHPLDAAKLAIEAGANLILMPVDTGVPDGLAALETYIRGVAAQADEGRISMDALNDSVLRVLKFKEKHGLLDPYTEAEEGKILQSAASVGSSAHHAEETEIARKAITLLKNDQVLPLNLTESAAVLVPYASQVRSAEYAVSLLKKEGRLPEETQIPVYHLPALTVKELTGLAQETRHLIVLSTAYSADELNPGKPAGADSAVLDLVIALSHASGNDVTLISTQLPYDAARYDADAVLIAYGARGMTEDPEKSENGISQYGPNVPAALYLLLSGEGMTGKLPVNIPAVDAAYQFTNEILYPRGYSYPAGQGD